MNVENISCLIFVHFDEYENFNKENFPNYSIACLHTQVSSVFTFRQIIAVSLNFCSNCCHTLLGVLAVADDAVTPLDKPLIKMISDFFILSQKCEVLSTLHQEKQNTLKLGQVFRMTL